MSLFNFELTPLDLIEPWGDPSNPVLHWFGLSDGSYYLDLGTCRLFESVERDDRPPHVNYYVVRLHEDILEMLPAILEPIPPSTARYFRDGSLGGTIKHLRRMCEEGNAVDRELEVAILALEGRQLDTGYLGMGPRIWIWSRGEKTIIEWDNRDRLVDGKPVWTAGQGRYELARDRFVEEVRSFHDRFMAAMEDRVKQVSENWTRLDVAIDLEQLQADQIAHSSSLASAFQDRLRGTDWEAVEAALAQASANANDW